MKVKLTPVPQLSAEDLTNREALLLQLLGEREECIQQLKDEIARLKGEKGKPKIRPSRLEPEKKAQYRSRPNLETISGLKNLQDFDHRATATTESDS